MTLGRTISPTAILIFGIAIAVIFSLRASCDINEVAHETICENTSSISTMLPGLSAEGRINCDRDDLNTVFKSAVSYFLEKHENSPPL